MTRAMLDLSGLEFLIVDDNAFTRRLVKTILRALGVHTSFYEAEDGADALRILAHHEPDLAVIDYMMEPVDGIEFVRTLRHDADHPCRAMPVIMLSAYSEPSIVARARDAGVNEFVAKPVSILALYLRIEEVILRPRQFVETKSFFGPDRHRHPLHDYTGPRRRWEDEHEDKVANIDSGQETK